MNSSSLKTLMAAATVGAAVLNLNAQTYLWQGHTDVGVNYEAGAWDLHVHAESLGLEFQPSDAVLGVNIAAAGTTVPSGTAWSFLGTAGSSVWILPQSQKPSLLFLGFGAEEMPSGLFTDDEVTLSLQSVNGTGSFAVYTTDMFGTPTVYMNSADGVSTSDAITLTAGEHTHVNWAFTEPGVYEVTFEATGTLADGNVFTSSGNVTYTFDVAAVPEPGSVSLLALGGLSLLVFSRRDHSCR
jgi:surface-anchored protein